MERDVNEIFDEIALSEEQFIQEGYELGVQSATTKGNPEAFHLGYHRGAELGAELGFYLGITSKLSEKNTELNLKQRENLNKIQQMIESFPSTNDENFDIQENINLIRAQYKKVCSLLKIDHPYPDSSKLSF